MNIYKMWKKMTMYKKNKRNIIEISLKDIDLKEYIIIDVRSKREFKEYHIDGSINIPLQELNIKIVKYVKNRENKILVCCQYGTRSKKAVQILKNLGFNNVYNLKGGLENI